MQYHSHLIFLTVQQKHLKSPRWNKLLIRSRSPMLCFRVYVHTCTYNLSNLQIKIGMCNNEIL